LLQALLVRDTKAGLQTVAALTEQGVDMKYYLLQLVEQIHKLLLQKAGVGNGELAQKTATDFSLEDIKQLLKLLTTAYGEMKYAVVPQLPLELAIITWADSSTVVESTTIETVKVTNVNVNNSNEVTVSSMRKELGNLARVKALYGEPKPAPKVDNPNSAPAIDLTQISNAEITPEWLQHFWNTFIAEIKVSNHILAGILRGCMIQSFDKKNLVIETSHTFHKERLDDEKTRQLMEQICKTLTGNSVGVAVRLRK
jgi:DNA polymerase III gamma/tau subunit